MINLEVDFFEMNSDAELKQINYFIQFKRAVFHY
jgi:hypothetical protein